jgi:FHS family L-fucose permease-like MFS transporter
MGLTFLETIANPYTTVLGAPQFAAVRINTAQTFNGVGWLIGPWLGSMFFYNEKGAEAAQHTLWIPYAIIAAGVLLLCVVFLFIKMPDLVGDEDGQGRHQAVLPGGDRRELWAYRHFSGAVAAQFFYVAAQAGIFSFFINFVTEELPSLGATNPGSWFLGGDKGAVLRNDGFFISDSGAALMMSWAFGLFLLGRLTGTALLARFSAHRMIALYATINMLLMVVVTMKLDWLSLAAVFASFFFMSIMFPTIFALGIFGLGDKSKWASAFIVMAIMGGAILPKLMGGIADSHGMSAGFLVLLVCFIVVAIYGFFWPRLSGVPGLVGFTTGSDY